MSDSTLETDPGSNGRIEWEARIPLLDNRFMWGDWLKVSVISAAVLMAIVPILAWVIDGDVLFLPLLVIPIVLGAMSVLFVLASLVLGNRSSATFAITDKGVEYRAGSRERKLDRLAFFAGLLARSPGTAGAGALAMSREAETTPWRDVRTVRVYEGPRVITLMDSWHVVARLYVPAESFAQVAEAVRRHQGAQHPPRPAASTPSRPWWWYAGWAVLCAALAVGAQAWPWNDAEVGARIALFASAAVLLSGVTGVGGRRLFGLLGLLGMLPLAWGLATSAMEPVEGLFGTSPAYTLDTPLLVLAAACTIALLVLAGWRAFGPVRERGGSD